MEIDREVILDLLPLYLEGECSPNTRALVEKYLETDPELARIAKQTDLVRTLKEIPMPLSKEKALETHQAAQRWMAIRTLGLAAIIAFVLLVVLLMAFAAIMIRSNLL